MNLLLIEPGERDADGLVFIRDGRLSHLREVQRCSVGSVLRVGEVNGALGSGEVIAMGTHEAVVRVLAMDASPPPPLPCTLVIALPRPKMLKRILVDATSLGVKRICFINSYRVEKSFWSSPLLVEAEIAGKCRLGLEQAIDTVMPAVTLHPRFRPFVEDELPALVGDSRALLAHPAATHPCPSAIAGPVTLAIGPEGGFIPFETELLGSAAGFEAVSLGPRILRVDTVVPMLLGRLFR
jgi:16S rRNA (uracil1498-N3)-methyltransferase